MFCFEKKYVPTVLLKFLKATMGNLQPLFFSNQFLKHPSEWTIYTVSVLVVIAYAERQFVRQGTHNWICTQADASRTTKAFSPSPGTGDWWWATIFLCKPNWTTIHTIPRKMRYIQDDMFFFTLQGMNESISHLLEKRKIIDLKVCCPGIPSVPRRGKLQK